MKTEKQPTILVVDDDHAHRTMLNTLIRGWGYTVTEADDGRTAVAAVEKGPFDLVLMDVRMLHMSGIEALDAVKAINPAIPVIIMTAYSSVETAVAALKKGAYDYLTKPLDFEKLKIIIRRAMDHLRLREENRMLRETLGRHFDRRNIIGNSPAMQRLLETLAQVAPSEATVLISGESGTGKELIAGAVHFNSPRKDGPFVKLNCAAVTETLLESELFGHEKGAFTGADRRREGKFYQANRGTIFLDEVSEMSLTMQVKLLRVLQEREVTRVGGESVVPVDVRVLVATNRDLEERIQEGKFREDLYYRLNVIRLETPPLRRRPEDIPLLANHFLAYFNKKNRKEIKNFTPAAMDRLIRYNWPGNVRELMNAVEGGVVLARSDFLDASDLPMVGAEAPADSPAAAAAGAGALSLEMVEKSAILQTLETVGGNKSEAARRLGITRKTLHGKLKRYGAEK
jgi:two-component system, NtrC family, response regulator HydG